MIVESVYYQIVDAGDMIDYDGIADIQVLRNREY